ncbi:MAG: hypothetical protein ACKOZM_08795 [Flavobacteriales bacterium]
MKTILKSSLCFLAMLSFGGTICSHGQTEADSTLTELRIDDEAVDTLSTELYLPDSLRNFCGCQSIETVRQCADCFKSSGPVLRTGYQMSFVSKTVVQGSCWGFVNAVYKKAGVSKETIFTSKEGGPYAKSDMLKPGDWIYHVNYSFRNVGHSAIFVCWKDKTKKQAITMSYVGMNRAVPGRLDVADLKGVYSIYRAKE